MKVMVNQVRCESCNDVISSKDTHDSHECTGGAIVVDGGTEYQRGEWKGDHVKENHLQIKDLIDPSLFGYLDDSKQPQDLDEVFTLIKELVSQIEEMKTNHQVLYKALHYENELKGHLAQLVMLKHTLDREKKKLN